MSYLANENRYNSMEYKRCGRSGLKLPLVSLGMWHNFGGEDCFENERAMARKAFDLGITHFDLANNYGPPAGSAEENMGAMLKMDFHPYRDELIISSKAGWEMWKGPYGDFGSRKYLVSSLDQSLKRMAKSSPFLTKDNLTEDVLKKVGALNDFAKGRGQSLAQMAVSWVLRHPQICSAIIGASRPEQIEDIVSGMSKREFQSVELEEIEQILKNI